MVMSMRFYAGHYERVQAMERIARSAPLSPHIGLASTVQEAARIQAEWALIYASALVPMIEKTYDQLVPPQPPHESTAV